MTSPLEELKRLLPQCLLQDRLRIGSRLALALAKSPAPAPVLVERLLDQARLSFERRRERQAGVPALSYPPNLPITARKDEIVAALRRHSVIIIAGETGSGKTTQIPKMCLEAGFGVTAKIGCTQPRRVAALSISRRIAEELDVTWGEEVGCKIRFSDQTSPRTYLKLMTDGILLAETQGDPFLSEYEVLMIDEAHERSLNIDFLLGYLQGLLAKRKDLKLLITSATLDLAAFTRAFAGAPVIEVSGRLYPVEVAYAPLDEAAEERGDLTYVDAAVNAVENVLADPAPGDVLVFMPGERDIREMRDRLQGREWGGIEVIPLFGQLSAAEQQRVFAPLAHRKVVVATNIAETSLTIPGIRYVIDTGLARLSRYNPRTRTRRLPIEPISQSSANQRKGRSGRVQNGVCIRLYSEADYLERPPHTQPEIQRANLAEVILRMKAFHLGEIETFPFLNPPTPAAIQAGYRLLEELGALDSQQTLTPLGEDLARLPVDPTLGRMLLQSQTEGALAEVLIIASGLSIQDPRERPLDQQAAADTAHRRFQDPTSDFLTLLNIWNGYQDQWETLKTQNQWRKFCRGHFLSYLRMREWQDLHAQLSAALAELGLRVDPDGRANTTAIHRSILTGLWGQVALRTGANLYRGAGNRPVMLFPGSALFVRHVPRPRAGARPAPGEPALPAPGSSQPAWIMAGEFVETSRLFARMVAGIDPLWILELAPHLCQRTYRDPQWNAEAGRVQVRERITFNGLEVLDRWIGYAQVNPDEANALFIQSALVEGGLEAPYPFLEHNRRVRQKLELLETRWRHETRPDLDAALAAFYAARLPGVSSVSDLDRRVREGKLTDPEFLWIKPEILLPTRDLVGELAAFPDTVVLENHPLPLDYAYAPGEERDGVTVKVPVKLAPTLRPGMLEWLVPGLREEQVNVLLHALPKTLRRPLMPLAPKAKAIAAQLPAGSEPLPEALTRCLRQAYGASIPTAAWNLDALPPHLRPRIEIVAKDQRILAAGRDLTVLQAQLKKAEVPIEIEAWRRAAQRWERFGITGWSFGDLPERIEVAEVRGVPLYAYPGLYLEDREVSVRLFLKPGDAELASAAGFDRLCELALPRELGWLQKDLRSLAALAVLYVTLGPAEELMTTAYAHLRRYLFECDPLFPLRAARFAEIIARAQNRLPGLAGRFVDRVKAVLELRQEILVCRHPYPGMVHDLNGLVPRQFLTVMHFDRLTHLPRYLKALRIRAERAALNPVKDREKARRVQPYLEALEALRGVRPPDRQTQQALDEFRWGIEEFKVSCFAQELGTAQPISPLRLDQQLEGLRGFLAGGSARPRPTA